MSNIVRSQPEVDARHMTFIEKVADGLTNTAAYALAFSASSPTNNTCRTEGSKLARRYAQEIQEAKQKRMDLVVSMHDVEAQERAKNASQRILNVLEVDAMICDMMSPTAVTEDVMVVDGKPMKVKRPLTPYERQQAARLYYMRFGHFAPAEANINLKQVTITVNADI